MRFLYVIRFRDRNNNPKTFQTTATSPERAAKKLRQKGRVTSVKKKKRLR